MMKESDIRSLKVVEELFQKEKEWTDGLLDSSGEIDKTYTVTVNCPSCGKREAEECLNKNAYHYAECVQCGTIYVNPRLTQEVLHEYYATREKRLKYSNFLGDADSSNEKNRIKNIFLPRKEKIERILLKRGKNLANSSLIDIGCATGQFLSVIENHAKSIQGVEASPQLAALASEKVPSARIIPKPIEQAALPENFFDIVTLWEVLEHAFDPGIFVEIISKILRPGGMFFASFPNIEGFDIQILWDRGNAFSAPSHLNYFRRSSVHHLFERFGLKVEEIVTPGKLDVDIVRNRVDAHSNVREKLGTYLTCLLKDESAEADRKRQLLQQFIVDAGLSSHMIVVCSKS